LFAGANISTQKIFAYRLIILNSPLSILNLASNLPLILNIEKFCRFVKEVEIFFEKRRFFAKKGGFNANMSLLNPSHLPLAYILPLQTSQNVPFRILFSIFRCCAIFALRQWIYSW